jgi:hypothetical protein
MILFAAIGTVATAVAALAGALATMARRIPELEL